MTTILLVGKTNKEYSPFLEDYKKRISKFSKINIIVIPDIKNARKIPKEDRKKKEGDLILSNIKENDYLIMMDDKGKSFSSEEFSKFIAKKQLHSNNIVFVIGGAYGFDDRIYKRANSKISLSKMTFTHQMVRIFLIEQIYRAYTILNNNPYHH